MGKYTSFTRQTPPRPRPWDVNPMWRGIGCLLLVIGPFVAFAAADLIVQMVLDRNLYPVPPEMMNKFLIPYLDFSLRHFYADLLVAGLLLLLGFGLIMIIYSIIYSIVGPSRYGPLDAKPVRRKVRRSR
jgi:hypothetical protein